MPATLLSRCKSDSISEFRTAARIRYDDALILAARGRRTAAIYLWGYCAEMIVKAAYFSLVGLSDTTPITWGGHLRPAINSGRNMGIIWPNFGAGHNVRAWAELLVLTRAASPATVYPGGFGHDVQRHGQRIERLWRETLRYHKNIAYPFEVRQVREATEWFLANANAL